MAEKKDKLNNAMHTRRDIVEYVYTRTGMRQINGSTVARNRVKSREPGEYRKRPHRIGKRHRLNSNVRGDKARRSTVGRWWSAQTLREKYVTAGLDFPLGKENAILRKTKTALGRVRSAVRNPARSKTFRPPVRLQPKVV
jgi:hypothetical protein